MLLLFVMALTDSKNAGPSPNYTPLFIGLVVTVIGMTFGMNCGYAINPARDLSPRIFTAMAGWGTEVFTYVVLTSFVSSSSLLHHLHTLLSTPIFQHSVWSVITAHKLTPDKV